MVVPGDGPICFVIAPIGLEGSEIRKRSDQVLKHVIRPAAKECGYTSVRADEISEPGLITSQVIQHIIDDPLVIADLTGRNPNVFYELAVRHAMKKPVVQIIQSDEPLPFDVAATRTIQVDHKDLDSVARAKEEIVRQIRTVEKRPTEVDTPISVAIELQLLKQSGNPLDKSVAEIVSMLQEIRGSIATIHQNISSREPILGPVGKKLYEAMRRSNRPAKDDVLLRAWLRDQALPQGEEERFVNFIRYSLNAAEHSAKDQNTESGDDNADAGRQGSGLHE